LILVRATRLTSPTVEFAEQLAVGSGDEVAFLLDGRFPVELEVDRPRVMVTHDACAELGLFCPESFQWRCGDYGLYLARTRFPDASEFWLIEFDIRLAGGGGIQEFFDFFKRETLSEFLACRHGPAPRNWSWYHHANGRNVTPYYCLFGIVRISARAVDALLAHRLAQGRRSNRRAIWPNDEAFVATTLHQKNFLSRDINGFGREFYNETTLALFSRIQGETFSSAEPTVKIYHPVLFGEDFSRGNTTSQIRESFTLRERVVRKARRFVNRCTKW